MGYLVMTGVLLLIFGTAWVFPIFYNLLLPLNISLLEDAEGVLARITMLLIAVCLWRVYPHLGISSMHLGSITKSRLKLLSHTFMFGCITIIIFYMLQTIFGYSRASLSFFGSANVIKPLVMFFVGALAIAYIEEIFFRGIVYNAFRQSFSSRWPAALLAAAAFGSMHWVDFGWLTQWGYGQVSFISALNAMNFLSIYSLSLFLLIAILALLLIYIYEKTGSLYAPIGLHAGLVFMVRLTSQIMQPVQPDMTINILHFTPHNTPYLLVAIISTACMLYLYKVPNKMMYQGGR